MSAQRKPMHSSTTGCGKCCGKGNREWSFRTDRAILYQMMDMPIVRIRSLDLKKNPFLDSDYFECRRKQHKKDKETAYFSSTAALSGYYAL